MPPTTPLSPAQRQHLAELLRLRCDTLAAILAARREGGSQAELAFETATQDADGAAARAPARELMAAVSAIDEREIEALRTALDRLQGPAYGICLDCTEPIPYGRLAAEPQALRCTACAARHEGAR